MVNEFACAAKKLQEDLYFVMFTQMKRVFKVNKLAADDFGSHIWKIDVGCLSAVHQFLLMK